MKDFSIRPYAFGKGAEAASTALTGGAYTKGFNLLDYSDDQISATVGVGRKFSEQWAGNVSVGYDTGAGNPVSTFGPTEGYWNVGLGLQFSPAPNYFIAGGVKYFMLGDATAHSGSYSVPGNAQNAQVAEFEDNDAWAYGLKLVTASNPLVFKGATLRGGFLHLKPTRFYTSVNQMFKLKAIKLIFTQTSP